MHYIISIKPFHKLLLTFVLLSAAVFGVFSQTYAGQLSDTQPVSDELMAGSSGRCGWGSGGCGS
jgi:hypothetical protein